MNFKIIIIFACCIMTSMHYASILDPIKSPEFQTNRYTNQSQSNQLSKKTSPEIYHIAQLKEPSKYQTAKLSTLPKTKKVTPQPIQLEPITFSPQVPQELDIFQDTLSDQNSQKSTSLSSQVINKIEYNFPQTIQALSQTKDLTTKTTQDAAELSNKVSNAFAKKLNSIVQGLIQRTVTLTIKTRMGLMSQVSLGQVFTISIKHLLFALSNIPEHLTTQSKKSINNFKKQIQYLAQQIANYNSTTIYKNPDAMLKLIEYMNQFLQENNSIYFTPAMLQQLNNALTTATSSSYIFKNQNIIFKKTDNPDEITNFFKQVIENTNNLENADFTPNLMHAIYDTDGYIDQIIQTWNNFQKDPLSQNPGHRQFAAFVTFLLLFENTMVATAIIIDQTAALYQVTNPVSVVINIS